MADIFGTPNNDTLTGTADNDKIFGYGGNDTLSGLAGNDELDGGEGNDSLNGGAGNDTLNGGDGSDQLNGGDGDDSLFGGAGDDFLDPGTGIDQVDGGAGNDGLFLNLSASTTNLSISFTNATDGTVSNGTSFQNIESFDLQTGSGNDTITTAQTTGATRVRSGAGNDTIQTGAGRDKIEGGDGDDTIRGGAGDDSGFERYAGNLQAIGLFGGTGNDAIFGEAGNDELYGEAGNDTLNGGDGDDFLDPGTGVDQVDGAAGNDGLFLNLSASTTNLSISFTNATDGTVSNGTSFQNIESFDLQTGSGNDTITTAQTTGATRVRSGAGNDTIQTGAGRDKIEGGDGDDTIRGGAGDDSGFERYAGNLQAIGLFGGTGNDAIFGEAGNDELYGEAGNDTLNGGDGDDFLDPGTGVDQVDGAAGNDGLFLNLSASTTNLSISFTNATDGTVSNGTSFQNIESFDLQIGSGNDNITTAQTTGATRVRSGAGNDTIQTGAGRDKIEGGDGDDTIRGGAGDDSGFERYAGNLQAIGLFGGAGNDAIFGEAGNDELYGEAGNDTLNGGDGDDFLDPGTGIDQVDGGAGNDGLFLNLSASTTNLSISFTNATDGTVSNGTSFQNIESFDLQTGSGNDTITTAQTTGATRVRSGAGNDTIQTGAGRDKIEGGDGDDTIRGGAGDDSGFERYAGNLQAIGLFGGTGNDAIFGEAGNDELYGEAGNDTLNGGDGDDYLDPGTGIDQVDGGAGNDGLFLNLSASTTNLSISFTNATSGTVSNGTSFQNIESFNILTGSSNDTITTAQTTGNTWVRSGAGNDTIQTGSGRDKIEGGDGDDTIRGGAGDDSGFESYPGDFERIGLYGGAGNDAIFGEAGNDELYGEAGNDTLDGGDGDDFLDPGTGVDTVIGGVGYDVLNLDRSALSTNLNVNYTDTSNGTVSDGTSFKEIERINLRTGSGNDTINITATQGSTDYFNADEIYAGAGNDNVTTGNGTSLIYGEAGNDTLSGGDGSDRVDGGDGDDQLFGGAGSDEGFRLGLFGGAGNDTLTGIDVNSNNPGIGERDSLSGGTGSDRFILGDSANIYYDDRNTLTNGNNDYATLTDFNPSEDKVQLQGSASNYRLEVSGSNTNLYIDKAGSEPDELIAVFQNVTGLNLTSNAFEYVAPINEVAFASGTYSVSENGTAQVTFTRVGSSIGQISVTLALTNGTATAPADYNNSSIPVTFADGETSKIVTIPIVDDTSFEANETINLALTNPSNGVTLGTQNTAVFTIIDNDFAVPGTLAFSRSTYSVNEDGTPVIAVTITRAGGSDGEVSATLTPSNGTATAPTDYNSNPITVTFADGETSKIVTIPIVDDTLFESNETINLALSNPTNGATIGTQNTATLTIFNNDTPRQGILSFSNPTYSVNEDGTPITTVTVTRTGGSDGEVGATISLSNGTATAPSDYNNNPITVTFANGDTAPKTITIPVINDTLVEGTETINLTLTSPTGGATIGNQNTAVVAIADDDTQLNFSTGNYTVREDGTAVTDIIVTRTGRATGAVSATITFTDGTATGCGCVASSVNNDFYNGSFSVTLADGETSKVIPVELASLGGNNAIRIRNDAKVEGDESFTINLTNPTGGATIGNQGSASVKILDDDVALDFSTANFSIRENGEAVTAVTVTRTGRLTGVVGATINLTDGTATAPSDYNNTPITVSFTDGETSKTVFIPVNNDITVEPNETVNLSLSNPTGGAVLGTQSTAVLTILDNGQAPTLGVSINKEIVAENAGNGAAIGTVTRNVITDQDLVVTLASSDTTEATVPTQVTILAGQASATFAINAVDDGVADGAQTAIITASATGFSSGSRNLTVTDINVPDLVVSNLSATTPLLSGKQAFFSYKVENKGLAQATTTEANPSIDRIYLSTDNKLDSSDTLLSEFQFKGEFPVGQFYERNVPFFVPRSTGQYYLIAQTDATNTVNEGGSIGDNNNTTILPISVAAAYRATVSTNTEIGIAGQSVTFQGQALSNGDNSPVPFEFVTIAVKNNGFVRELSAFTDANGNFTSTFKPLAAEGGQYQINAYFPNNPTEDTAAEDSFKLLGMRFASNSAAYKVIADKTFTAQVNLENLTDVALNGLTYTVEGAPSDWNIQVNTPSTLAGSGNDTISYTITAPNNSAITQDSFNIKLTSAEGVTASLPVSVNLERNVPRLVASTNLVSSGMLRGNQTAVEFEVKNEGGAVAENIELLVPNVSWLKLASPTKINALAPGESTKVTLLLTPEADLALTEYTGNIVLDAVGNDGDLLLPFNFRAVSNAIGEIRINTVDELFYFAEGSPKLANATVTLRNYFTNEVVKNAVTDETGMINLSNINEGFYKLEITSDNHETFRQTIQLDAGETENINAFLSRQTVRYIWNVTPTEIEDRYNISVESVFETNVPVPTLTIDPPLIDLADLDVIGEVMQIDMTITNHGLIAANDVRLNFGEHPFYKIEPLIENAGSLSAKSSLTIPVKITRIADFDTLNLNSSNFQIITQSIPSIPCSLSGGLSWSYICGGNNLSKGSAIAINNVEGNCLGSGFINPFGGFASGIIIAPIGFSSPTPCEPPEECEYEDVIQALQNDYNKKRDTLSAALANQKLCIAQKAAANENSWGGGFVKELFCEIAENARNGKESISDRILSNLPDWLGNVRIPISIGGVTILVPLKDIAALLGGLSHFINELTPGFADAARKGTLDDSEHQRFFEEAVVPCFEQVYQAGQLSFLAKLIAQQVVPSGAALLREILQGLAGFNLLSQENILKPNFLSEAKPVSNLDITSSAASNNFTTLPLSLKQEELFSQHLASISTLDVSANGQFFLKVGENIQLQVNRKNSDGTTIDITSSASGTKYFVMEEDEFVQVSADGLLNILNTRNPIATYTPTLYVMVRNGDDIGIGQFAITDVDSDGDQIVDSYERKVGLNPNIANDAQSDIDGDGLTDIFETLINTKPIAKDSDGDGVDDASENQDGTDPLDPRFFKKPSDGVCAQVRISIDQEAVMTRSAFLGELEIDNGNTTNLENLTVTLQVKDAQGNVVNDLFGITNPILKNITAVDGTGILRGDDPNTPQDEGIGGAEWTFIPTNLAAPEVPTQYSIGGTLSYTENGQLITVPLLSTPITVYPQAELYLDYFQQRDVFADDPFTDTVEPSVPFSLGVLVRNEGKGDAKNLKITSAQPKIIENEKGLLIDFQIIGSQVNNEAVTPSLSVNFGDIKAGETAVADWLLKSSLQGKFIDYDATFEHVNGLGNAELSLIKEVKIHELIRKVKVDHANPDDLSDFLVNDQFDANFTPDTLYFSSGGTAPVKAVTNTAADGAATFEDLTVQVSANVESGWNYLRLLDPGNGQFQIKRVVRADGTEVVLDNVWTTDRTFPATGRPIYENILHLLDNNATAGAKTYTITYTTGDQTPPKVRDIVDVDPNPRNTTVNTIDVVFTEPIKAATFDNSDISLTLDGVALNTNNLSISQVNTNTYRIGNLQGITGNVGQYQLSVNAAGVEDFEGLSGTGIVNESWVFTGDRPAVAGIVGFTSTRLNTPINNPITVTFTEAINPSSFDFNDLFLNRDGGGDLIKNTVTITPINASTYQISNLGDLTNVDGEYTFLVNARGVIDTDGNTGVGAKGFTWALNTNAPKLLSITDVTSPRNTKVTSLDIAFSKAIDSTTFDLNDVILTRDGTTNLITNSANLTQLNDTTYRLNALTGLQSTDGSYSLAVVGSGIKDTNGNVVTNSLTENWTLDTIAPSSATNIQITNGVVNESGQIRVNSTSIDITGSLSETGLKVYVRDKVLNQSLAQASVIGTNFNASVQLSSAGARELEIQVVDAAGNITTTPLNLFADITKPTISQFLNLPETPTLNPVNYIDVKFSEQINLNTFDRSDITLTRDGETITLPNTVTIEYLSDTTYRINGLNNFTNTPGTYQLRVDATTIQDNAGNNGDIARTATFTISTPATPGVTFTQTNGSTIVTEAGNSDTYTLVLRTQPTADVTITLAPGNQITSDKTTLTFTTVNWNTPQTITVNAVNDTTPEGNHNSTITHSITSTDGNYNSLTLPNINVAIQDNDVEIRGIAWNDINGNSIKDNGESTLPGWRVYLDANNNSQLDASETSTLTDSQGTYTFNDLRPGTYNVAQVVQDGWKQTHPLVEISTTASNTEIFTPSAPLSTTTNTQPITATNLINLDDFQADARFANIKGQGYATVIIDTGIDLDHPLFGADNNGDGIADRIIYQYDFADKDNNASDRSGHGSHIASIAASVASGANIIVLKVFKDNGTGYFSELEAALQWVNQNADKYNIASVNLSVGDGQNWVNSDSRYGIGDELAAIASKNIIIAAAAGNSFYQFNSKPGLAYPAADPNTIAVGAVWADNFGGSKTFSGGATDYTTDADRIASFSQRHATLLDVFAPGILVTGANATGGTQTMGGTSKATPFISGVAVLAQQIAVEKLGRKLTLSEFRSLIDNTSIIINDGDNENDNVTNTGLNFPRVNMLALAEGILNLNSQVVNPGNSNPNNNSSDDPLYLPSGSLKLSHSVTLAAGEIATNINFGNQRIPNSGKLAFSTPEFSIKEDGTAITAVTINRTEGSDGEVEAQLTLTDGTATAGTDYNNALIPVLFADGELSKTVVIPIFDDGLIEGNETVNLSLSNPKGGATIGAQNTAVFTIVDNDTSSGVTVTGGSGNDILTTGSGRDIIIGGAGDDELTGGVGSDTLTGGLGNDRFVYTSIRDRGDTITDFEVGFDKIVFTQLLDSLVSGGYSGTNAFTDGYVRVVQGSVSNNFGVEVDADGLTGRDIFRPFITVNVASGGALNNPNNFVF
ncbi:hypothetical protein NIES4071_27480 [Calothrix sp. NIES-4071]|nr:hypothetical protein NIES4071_27480 [Calothrix sp. NIES-4071]BAZ57070.1 hypothetical protein NIES4105_27420 [Calothrix sp. NIES-4105]